MKIDTMIYTHTFICTFLEASCGFKSFEDLGEVSDTTGFDTFFSDCSDIASLFG